MRLEECEEYIMEVQKKKEQAAKDPEILKKEQEEYEDLITRMKKAIEADRKFNEMIKKKNSRI